MASKQNRNIPDEMNSDISTDIDNMSQTIKDVLNSWGEDAGDDAKEVKRKAKSLLRDTRARMNNRSHAGQRARDVADSACTWMHERPGYSVGIAATVGMIIGALLASRR